MKILPIRCKHTFEMRNLKLSNLQDQLNQSNSFLSVEVEVFSLNLKRNPAVGQTTIEIKDIKLTSLQLVTLLLVKPDQ